MIGIVIAALVAVACVVYVALPFLREPEPESDRLVELTPEQEQVLGRLEERDRALSALRELELDHRTGKIADDDYLEQRAVLRAEAAQVLASDGGGGGGVDGDRVRELRNEAAAEGAVLSGLRNAGRGQDGDPA
jgi:hypothetical protein